MSLSGNKVTFNTIPTPGKYSFTITATNSCGRTDTEIIPVTVSTLPSSITITGTTRPHVTFSYANLPTTDMQGMFLVNLSTGANVLSFGVSGSVGMGSALVPDSAPAGRYLLRALAVMNNRTIVESAPFDLGL